MKIRQNTQKRGGKSKKKINLKCKIYCNDRRGDFNRPQKRKKATCKWRPPNATQKNNTLLYYKIKNWELNKKQKEEMIFYEK